MATYNNYYKGKKVGKCSQCLLLFFPSIFLTTLVKEFKFLYFCIIQRNCPYKCCNYHFTSSIYFLSYCVSDFLSSVYGIPLTPNYLPERPDGVFCTVIKPTDSKDWSFQEEAPPRHTRRPVQDNGPFASRDYRYYIGGVNSQGI